MTDIENDILSDDDAMLLLRVAGELEDDQMRLLDARLAREPQLQARLASLTAFDARLQSETTLRPVAASDSRQALNTSLRIVREQALVLQGRPATRIGHRRLAGIGGWAWGTAVAACVAVGLVVWISNSDPTPLKSTPIVASTPDEIQPHATDGEFAAAFGTVEPASTVETANSESPASEIDTQIDALDMLAVMNDPN